jgi:hypothetical protein
VGSHELLATAAAAALLALVVRTIHHPTAPQWTWEWWAEDVESPDDDGSDDGGSDRVGEFEPFPLPGGGTLGHR